MKEMFEKFYAIIEKLEKTNDKFVIFCLFLREGVHEKWDIVVSAPWLNVNDIKSYDLINIELKAHFNKLEILKFDRIVILDQREPVVSAITSVFDMKEGRGRIALTDCSIVSDKVGFKIKHGYILRSLKMKK